MGNEIVIPGYPPIDPLVFNPGQQNGYLSANLTNPAPGTSVTRYGFNLSQSSATISNNDSLESLAYTGTVNAGTARSVSSLNFGGANEPTGPTRFIFQCPGPVTTGTVFLTPPNTEGSNPGIDLVAATAEGGFFQIDCDRSQGFLTLTNTDAAAQTVRVWESPIWDDSPLQRVIFTYDMSLALNGGPLVVQQQDIWQVRRWSLSLYPQNGVDSMNYVRFGAASISVFFAAPSPDSNIAPRIIIPLTRGDTPYFAGTPVLVADNAAIRYWLDTPFAVLGTDGSPVGSSYSPYLQLNVDCMQLGQNGLKVQPGGWALVDYYPGANQ